jgi:FHS family L-fucose permease-like MFS transporter
MNTSQKSYALPIAMMFALFFMVAFVTGLPSPMGVIIKNQFGASNFQAQLGFVANFIAYAFMGIPAGMMLKKLGYKKTALIAIGVGFTGVGIQCLSGVFANFNFYLAGAFVSGFSMCLLNTVVNPMLNTLGGGGKKGNQLLQFGGSLNSIAATIVPVLVGYLMGAEAGRTIEKAYPAMFIAMGIFALAFIVLAFVQIPEPEEANKSEVSVFSPLKFRHLIFGIIAIFVYVGIEIGIPSTANLYMTNELGIDAGVAGAAVGIYWFLMMVGRFVGGLLGGKVSTKTMITVVSLLGLIFVTCGILMPTTVAVKIPTVDTPLPINILFFVLCGLCTSVMWGGIFNLAVEGLGKYTAAASGLFMVMVCGGGIIPAIQGAVADHTSYLTSYWVMFIGIAYILWYAVLGSKHVNKDIPVE